MKNCILFLFVLVGTIGFGQVNQVDAQGRKQGVWKKAYENNSVFRYVGQYKDDKPYGKFVYYYPSGDVQAVIEFNDDGSIGYSKMYHESGYMMARGKYVNQEKDSMWVYFDDRGIISYTENYVAGKLDGQKVIYYEPYNGKYLVAKYYTYSKGVLQGEFKSYYPNQQLESEGSYENGRLNGMVKYYYTNGKTMKLERYKNGVKHGYWIFYNEDGTQAGYKLFWDGVELKGAALAAKEAELKEQKNQK